MRWFESRCALFIVAATAALSAWAGIPPVDANGTRPSLAPMLERVTPGVVNIAARGRVRVQSPLLDDPFFRRFFDLPRERPTQSLGSGVIVDARAGIVLTNHHVIANAERIGIILQDGRQFEAEPVGSDPDTDIAVLRIPAEGLVAVPWGDSDRLRVGDFVVAIGNPFGLGQTVTSGIVSALQRSGLGIEAYEDFIQTDASINPGNSGGALVDLDGRLVGINTAIIGPAGGNVGIGFAIPANMARQIMAQILEHGEVRRGQLGIAVQDLDPELSAAFGLETARGVVITHVQRGSPAEEAGLKPGDVILEVDGRGVRHSDDLRNVIGLQPVGKRVRLKIQRDGEVREVEARIAERRLTTSPGARLHPRLAGAKLADADEALGRPGVHGVLVVEVEPGSPAAAAGLAPGDLIVSINRRPVRNLAEAAAAVAGARGALLLNLRRGDAALFLLLR